MYARIASLLLTAGLLGACAAPIVEGANVAKDQIVYDENIDKAKAGDAAAQFKVGEALCCNLIGAGKQAGLYDTKKAVRWLCASAAQGYGPAAYKVGKVYAGDVVDGVRLIRRATAGIVGTAENNPVAYAWLREAEAKKVDGAKDRAMSLWQAMSPEDRSRAKTLVESPAPLPCAWDKVIGAKSAPDA